VGQVAAQQVHDHEEAGGGACRQDGMDGWRASSGTERYSIGGMQGRHSGRQGCGKQGSGVSMSEGRDSKELSV
jgi:hypothetical protein